VIQLDGPIALEQEVFGDKDVFHGSCPFGACWR
jgi:hypothetical protein